MNQQHESLDERRTEFIRAEFIRTEFNATRGRATRPRARAAAPRLAVLALAAAAILLFSAHASAQQQPQKKNSCIDCHSRLEGRAGDAARQFDGDIHKSRGLSCNDCHGGDPT